MTQIESVFSEAELVLNAFEQLQDGGCLRGRARVAFQRVAVEIKRVLDQVVIRLWDRTIAPTLSSSELLKKRRRVAYPNISRWDQFSESVRAMGAPIIDLPNLYRTSDNLSLAEQFTALLACEAPFAGDIHACLRLTGLITSSSHYGLVEVKRTPSVAFIFGEGRHEIVRGNLSSRHQGWLSTFRRLDRADMLSADAGDQAYGPPTLLGSKSVGQRSLARVFGPPSPWYSLFDAEIATGPIHVRTGVLKMAFAVYHVARGMLDGATLADQNGRMF